MATHSKEGGKFEWKGLSISSYLGGEFGYKWLASLSGLVEGAKPGFGNSTILIPCWGCVGGPYLGGGDSEELEPYLPRRLSHGSILGDGMQNNGIGTKNNKPAETQTTNENHIFHLKKQLTN